MNIPLQLTPSLFKNLLRLNIPHTRNENSQNKKNIFFQPPIPRTPWNSTLKAKKYSLRCPEKLTLSKNRNIDLEDCLSICVYTKNIHGKLPIMFYIYGGGFANGTAKEFPPGYLLEKDIVLIVPQYRVGALGWLSTNSKEIPGNAAFMDLIAALEWVQKYASHFGGDPKQVTIFGQSAGAMLAGLLTLSPKVPNGLFHRLIMQSASVLMLDAEKEPIELANKYCQRAECSSCSSIEEINSCLVNLPVSTLLDISSDNQYVMSVNDFYGYVPNQPSEMNPRPSINNMSIMSGVTKQEGSFLLAVIYDAIRHTITNATTTNDIFNILYEQLEFKDPSGLSKPMLAKSIFQSDELSSNDLKASIPGFIEVCNYFMKFPVYSLMQKYSHNTNNVYLYSFDYMGEHTRFGYEFGNDWYPFNGGVHHSDDNIYLFPTHKLNGIDEKIARMKVDLWTSFAIDGRPSVGGVEMPRFDGKNGLYFKIDKEITIGSDFREEFVSTVQDPHKEKFIRKDVCFGVC